LQLRALASAHGAFAWVSVCHLFPCKLACGRLQAPQITGHTRPFSPAPQRPPPGMGFLDKLVGKRPQQEPAVQEAQAEEPSTSSGATASDVLRDVAPGTHMSGQPKSRLYDPYEGLSGALPAQRRAAFQVPEAPEFVFQEDAAVHRRSWGENLQFYTGMGYLGGEHARATPGALGRGGGDACSAIAQREQPRPPPPAAAATTGAG